MVTMRALQSKPGQSKPAQSRSGHTQRGITLIELVLATAAGAILLAGLNGVVKIGLDAQTNGRAANELTYQGRFALERMIDKARATTPKELTTPAANTTSTWFAPVMYCRNAANQLIETIVGDTACSGTTVIASNVSTFAASLPVGMGPVDRSIAVISLTMSNGNTALKLSSSIRLGGGEL